MAELIVVKRLVKEIIITRLPPGHTHEDIDAMFGIIWSHFRDMYANSPQEAVCLFKQAFSGDTYNCNLYNLLLSIL